MGDRDYQPGRGKGWAVLSLAPLSIVWHNNKASDLILPLLGGSGDTCTYYIFHFLNSKAPAATEGGQGRCQSFSSGCAEISPLLSSSLEASRADGLFLGVNNWKPSPSSGTTNAGHTLIPVSYLLEKYRSLGIAHTGWVLHWAAALKLGACAQFLLILNCGDAQVLGSSETICVWHS